MPWPLPVAAPGASHGGVAAVVAGAVASVVGAAVAGAAPGGLATGSCLIYKERGSKRNQLQCHFIFSLLSGFSIIINV